MFDTRLFAPLLFSVTAVGCSPATLDDASSTALAGSTSSEVDGPTSADETSADTTEATTSAATESSAGASEGDDSTSYGGEEAGSPPLPSSPYSFFGAHCEPTASVQAFSSLENLIADATEAGVRVSILLNPAWVPFLSEAGRVDTVRGWVEAGHGIGIHHHGPGHSQNGWNGYTNLDQAQVDDYRQHRNLAPRPRIGTFDESWEALSDFATLVGAGPIIAGTSTDKQTELGSGTPFLVEAGSGYEPHDGAMGKTTVLMRHGFGAAPPYVPVYKLNAPNSAVVDVEDMIAAYEELVPGNAYGLILHCNEYVGDVGDDIHAWFDYLSDRDGKLLIEDVAMRMIQAGDVYGTIQAERCGNTTCDGFEWNTHSCPIDCGDTTLDVPNGACTDYRGCEKGCAQAGAALAAGEPLPAACN